MAREKPSRWRWLRQSARVAFWGGILAAGLYGFHRTELFLLRDPRFVVQPPDFGLDSPSLVITGDRYASRAQILRAFQADFGRSLYQVPLKERRAQLLRIGWVRSASVSRLWPDRLLIQVVEREPVAFLEIPDGTGLSRFALIDADGVVLAPPRKSAFKLPVLLGVKLDEAAPARRARIRRMQQLVTEVGAFSAKISEVDVSDPDNLKVRVKAGNRAVTLLLGDRNYALRTRNFESHYAQILQRVPDARRLDLRAEDRITVVEGDEE